MENKFVDHITEPPEVPHSLVTKFIYCPGCKSIRKRKLSELRPMELKNYQGKNIKGLLSFECGCGLSTAFFEEYMGKSENESVWKALSFFQALSNAKDDQINELRIHNKELSNKKEILSKQTPRANSILFTTEKYFHDILKLLDRKKDNKPDPDLFSIKEECLDAIRFIHKRREGKSKDND